MQSVVVLFDKLTCRIDNTTSKMANKKAFVISYFAMRFEFRLAWHIQSGMFGVFGMHFGCEMSRAWCRQFALFVKQVEYAYAFRFNEIYYSKI
jgi:hypothetical protein